MAAPILISLAALPAAAQLNVLAPTFNNLNGAAVWGSIGFSTGTSGSRDHRPMPRGGFAAFYGPFGGRGDTVVTYTQSVADSTDTTFCDGAGPGSQRVHRSMRSTRQYRSDAKRLGGGGKVTLVVGYQHSSFYRFGARQVPEKVPVGGVFIATLLGPYSLPLAPARLQWYGGAGGTIVRLSDLTARADTVEVELTTERPLAPEALVMLMYNVAPSYRVFLGASYQYLRFGSVRYQAAQPGERIPGSILTTLPQELKLQSVHVSLGFSFTASGLIPGR
jgi:opacity protein-like surface antigen